MAEIQFDSLGDFLDMGGYAFYVWSAYLFCALVFGANLYFALRGRRLVIKALKARMQRDADQSGQPDAED
jgi:heme exporter protein D